MHIYVYIYASGILEVQTQVKFEEWDTKVRNFNKWYDFMLLFLDIIQNWVPIQLRVRVRTCALRYRSSQETRPGPWEASLPSPDPSKYSSCYQGLKFI